MAQGKAKRVAPDLNDPGMVRAKRTDVAGHSSPHGQSNDHEVVVLVAASTT